MTFDEFRHQVESDAAFADFRAMFADEALLRFVYHEKCIMGSVTETRIFVNSETNTLGGIDHSTQMVLDECYGVFAPFQLKGVWMPIADGTLYSVLPQDESCPLIRQRNSQDEFLFLIHPKSETIYAELMQRYHDQIVIVSAFSLSSPRSLLVAMPQESGACEPVMVKVSLNQKAHDVLRLLSERECALSVANTAMFGRALTGHASLKLGIFEDPLAFIPKAPVAYDHGVLYRKLPWFLDPKRDVSAPMHYAMPLLALYGEENSPVLHQLVQRHGGNVTEFLQQQILQPLAEAIKVLLTEDQLSMEAHGQNLLLILDETHAVWGLMYRDMGGVNTKIEAQDDMLPANLRDPSLSYFHNFAKDSANALEHLVVWRGLFPLTKQLVKHADEYIQDDPVFRRWYEKCLLMKDYGLNVLGNWTDGEPGSNGHIMEMPMVAFNRYGYVESLFGDILLNCMQEKIDEDDFVALKSRLFSPEKLQFDNQKTMFVAPCTYNTFFDELIRCVLQHQLTLSQSSLRSYI